MRFLIIYFAYFILALSITISYGINNNRFPDDFKFGVATSAYQIEGGWDEDGKGPNIWDHLARTNPGFIDNNENADVACDSYHKYKEDVAMIKNLGVDYYRFSLSWTRILPTGFIHQVNEAGVQYYRNLINELKKNNIEPFVTLYHWDLPQAIEDAGGWTNEFVVDAFGDYARLCFQLFGEDVKYWNTINEPKQICQGGYGEGMYAPAIQSKGVGEYLCTHNILKAHARAWHIYDDEFRATQKGKISITVDSFWYEPASDSIEDRLAAETNIQFALGWFLNPIFNGNYPRVMISRIAMRSKAEGFPRSRLPTFTEEEIAYIKGTHDFLGFNFYTSNLVKSISEPEIGTPTWDKDIGTKSWSPDEWEHSVTDWLKVTPWGFRKILKWLKDNYNNPEIMITENGVSDAGKMDDENSRVHYHKEHLSNLRDAMEIDKVNVTAYTVWSLMDNLEWKGGYVQKFGLYYVDFTDPNRPRRPRRSAEFYKKLVKTHCIEDGCNDAGAEVSTTPYNEQGAVKPTYNWLQPSFGNSLGSENKDYPKPHVYHLTPPDSQQDLFLVWFNRKKN